MSRATEGLIAAYRAAGLAVVDMRGQLKVNPDPARVYGTRRVDGIFGSCVHHTAGSHGGGPDQFHRVADYQVDHRNAPAIMYTRGVPATGELCIFHDLETKPWSQGDASQPGDENAQFLSCVVRGSFYSRWNKGGVRPSERQLATLQVMWDVDKRFFGWTDLDLYGHFDFGKAACPGEDIEGWILDLREHASTVYADLDTVTERQTALVRLGFPLPRWGADGHWGEESRLALLRFEQKFASKYGLTPDGTWDHRTANAIRRELVGSQQS